MPTYRDMGDHTESVEIEYDPKVVTYEALLDTFWQGHECTRRAYSRQYMSAIWYQDKEQERAAKKSREAQQALQTALGRTISTVIEPASLFTQAEGYHQKFSLRSNKALMSHFEQLPEDDFVNSSVASRLNGYVGGYGSDTALRAEMDGFSLSPVASAELLRLCGGKNCDGGGISCNRC